MTYATSDRSNTVASDESGTDSFDFLQSSSLAEFTASDIITQMKIQEYEGYSLPGHYWENALRTGNISLCPMEKDDDAEEKRASKSEADEMETPIAMYLKWRHQMIGWFFEVSTSCDYQHDTSEIAINLADRFMAYSPRGDRIMLSSNEYQIVCMTCMYIAAKIHEEECLSPEHLVVLSGERFTEEQIIELEYEILEELDWRVNPPTRMAYMRSLMDFVPEGTFFDKTRVMAVAEEQVRRSLTSTIFLPTKNSTVAFCAVMNAIQCSPTAQRNTDVPIHFHNAFRTVIGLDRSLSYDRYIESVQEALLVLVAFDNDEDAPQEITTADDIPREFDPSPKIPSQDAIPLDSSVQYSPTSVSARAA
mmetsp:Transcript_24312/g.42732  ORF Transcript_24312/g.42732 Transcript_24312/m.42732 type:complete len:363 (+) Transcript_24312:79-1167(+)